MQGGLVTVLGGSGFIGRYVVKYLAQAGWRIRVAVRRPEEALFLKPLGVVGQISITQANVRMPRSVASAVAGADAVVNMVGILNEAGAQTFSAVQVRGASIVAKAAREAGVRRLIHMSAIGANADSMSLYARTKAAGEVAAQEEFPDVTILRPSIVFGPEDDFFNRFAKLARILPILPLIDGGHTRFQPVYVGDIAAVVTHVLANQNTARQTLELGGPRIYTFRELLEIVLRETGRKCLLLPVPAALANLPAFLFELLPSPPLTRDQIKLLAYDNVVNSDLKFTNAASTNTGLDAILPSYLCRYRRGGAMRTPRFG